MAFVIKDRVAEQTVTTGTGTVTLLGAVRGYQSFSAIGNSNSTAYLILGGNGTDWEVGIGTYTSAGTTLSRTTILGSSNAGSAISLTGTSLVMCTNPANQVSANGLFDQLFGAVDGNIIKRQSGVWSGAVLSSGGLFNQTLSATPTAALTGLNTWYSQGAASIADGTAGVYLDIDAAHAGIVGRYKTAPATPYTISALIGVSPSLGANGIAGLGFTDGTKVHLADIGASATAWQVQVAKWTNATTFSAADYSAPGTTASPVTWLRIKDDGTNITFYDSPDGANWISRFTTTRAAGFLGAGGYTNVGIWGRAASAGGNETGVTVLSWTQG